MIEDWYGNHKLLEDHHGYIQWIFPLFEGSGVNWDAQRLTYDEAEHIRSNLDCAFRVIQVYRYAEN